MNVSYEISEDDQLAFNTWLLWQGVRSKKGRYAFARVYGIFATGFGVFLMFWIPVSAEVFRLGMLCTFLGLFVGLMPEWSTRLWRKMAIAQFRKPKFQKYLGTRTASVEATGLRVVGATGERLLLWDGLTHAETDTLDIFHLAPADAIVIPRRAFASDAHRQSFLSAIEAAKTGAVAPAQSQSQTQTWWTQSGVDEPATQSQRQG
jgi:hypothetical protein